MYGIIFVSLLMFYAMNESIVISNRVLKSLQSMPCQERRLISQALTNELLLGEDPVKSLTPFQSILYTMIRFYIQKDNPHLEGGA